MPLPVSNGLRQPLKIWTVAEERSMAYLWYVDSLTQKTMSQYSTKTERQCATKKEEFPIKLPEVLVHEDRINVMASACIFERKQISVISDLLSSEGAKTAGEVYEVWKEMYGKRNWNKKELDELRVLVNAYDRKISWKAIEGKISFNASRKQCKLAYEAHFKKESVAVKALAFGPAAAATPKIRSPKLSGHLN
ncbi:MAG: hypothetical protein S4CHLAM37_12470 [Chlamydiia bacterium]|nr:hypothetical protein [Chlamydiia bacterium]